MPEVLNLEEESDFKQPPLVQCQAEQLELKYQFCLSLAVSAVSSLILTFLKLLFPFLRVKE